MFILDITLMTQVGLGKCAKCGDYLSGSSVLVEGASYHPECFLCSDCQGPIIGQFYSIEAGGSVYTDNSVPGVKSLMSDGAVLTAGDWPSPAALPVDCPYWTSWSRPWTAPGTRPASPAASAPPAWMEASLWRMRTMASSAESAS